MAKKRKIFIIEDTPQLADALSTTLQQEGFNVEIARDGEEAAARIQSAGADLVILDILMPKMNGLEFLKKMREEYKMQNVPVIVLSNLYNEENVAKMQKFGIQDYLIKSELQLDEIVGKIKSYLVA